MISEFEVIRMLLEIQEAPVYAPAGMMVKTKDALITGGIRKMLDRAESVQKPERSAGEAEQTAERVPERQRNRSRRAPRRSSEKRK